MMTIPAETYLQLVNDSNKLAVLMRVLTPVSWLIVGLFLIGILTSIYIAVKWWTTDESYHEWKNIAEELGEDYQKLEKRYLKVRARTHMRPFRRTSRGLDNLDEI